MRVPNKFGPGGPRGAVYLAAVYGDLTVDDACAGLKVAGGEVFLQARYAGNVALNRSAPLYDGRGAGWLSEIGGVRLLALLVGLTYKFGQVWPMSPREKSVRRGPCATER